MKFNRLGQTGLFVSELCLGTMTFGGSGVIGSQIGDLQQAAAGLAWIDKKLGHAAVMRLFDHAPRVILAGELPD